MPQVDSRVAGLYLHNHRHGTVVLLPVILCSQQRRFDRGFTTDGRWLLSCSYNGESAISAPMTMQIPLGQLLIYC
ncbi:hypothetical protein U9M48_001726 [Paspalum notatum var. saurae]|uniref:Uncharacterized protein n=1 Tax=Paspalum notatum var. saurae TaxID=547442 RepID=A0AAQ3PIJ6_PASNO